MEPACGTDTASRVGYTTPAPAPSRQSDGLRSRSADRSVQPFGSHSPGTPIDPHRHHRTRPTGRPERLIPLAASPGCSRQPKHYRIDQGPDQCGKERADTLWKGHPNAGRRGGWTGAGRESAGRGCPEGPGMAAEAHGDPEKGSESRVSHPGTDLRRPLYSTPLPYTGFRRARGTTELYRNVS